jgi:translocation and assembly module TamB
MNIAVDLNSNLTFDSNLGKMLVDGKLSIVGRPDRPAVNGQFQILSGYVYYLDRKFTVSHGSVRQYDPLQMNPSLDITASTSVTWFPPQGGKTDYDISLAVKGDLSDPRVTVTSAPSLPLPQIVSLLTMGTLQTGLGSDFRSRTGSVATGQLAGFGTRRLARLLNVESVDIYGNVFGRSTPGTEPQLAVTKQVSSRVAVTYTKGLTRLSQQAILVSYRILPFMYLDVETDQQARGGADLKFRWSH